MSGHRLNIGSWIVARRVSLTSKISACRSSVTSCDTEGATGSTPCGTSTSCSEKPARYNATVPAANSSTDSSQGRGQNRRPVSVAIIASHCVKFDHSHEKRPDPGDITAVTSLDTSVQQLLRLAQPFGNRRLRMVQVRPGPRVAAIQEQRRSPDVDGVLELSPQVMIETRQKQLFALNRVVGAPVPDAGDSSRCAGSAMDGRWR